MGDNSFLREFRARMLSSRSILGPMILRDPSNGSPAKRKVLVSSESEEKSIGFLIRISKVEKHTVSHVIYNTDEARASARLRYDR